MLARHKKKFNVIKTLLVFMVINTKIEYRNISSTKRVWGCALSNWATGHVARLTKFSCVSYTYYVRFFFLSTPAAASRRHLVSEQLYHSRRYLYRYHKLMLLWLFILYLTTVLHIKREYYWASEIVWHRASNKGKRGKIWN